MAVETRLTLRPGDKGTRKLVERFGKRLGAVWRAAQKLWEIRWSDARRLGIADRVVQT